MVFNILTRYPPCFPPGEPAALEAVRDEISQLSSSLGSTAGEGSPKLPGSRIFPQSMLNEMKVINSVISEVRRGTIDRVIGAWC